jgi:hypothetical protein
MRKQHLKKEIFNLKGNTMDLSKFDNDDYQNRKGGYPKSNIPTSINSGSNSLEFSFKNTDEVTSEKFVVKFCSNNGLTPTSIKCSQDGDYQNDWVIVFTKF